MDFRLVSPRSVAQILEYKKKKKKRLRMNRVYKKNSGRNGLIESNCLQSIDALSIYSEFSKTQSELTSGDIFRKRDISSSNPLI